MSVTPRGRLRVLVERHENPSADFVLYWMTAYRRNRFNFALQRATEHSIRLKKPLLVFEPLRCGYRWNCDRFQQFVVEGMRDNAATFGAANVTYFPYLERRAGDGKGLLAALGARACLVVSDDYPSFFYPSMYKAAAERLAVPLELVDSNGLLPVRSTDQVFPTAHAFRRHLQKTLRPHLSDWPIAEPLLDNRFKELSADIRAEIPIEAMRQWKTGSLNDLATRKIGWSGFDVDHSVGVSSVVGGSQQAKRTLDSFAATKLARYGEERNDPDADAASGLSPYLHFGHISPHEIAQFCLNAEGWRIDHIATTTTGSREGWWGVSASAESFLDELVTWRELGFNFVSLRADYDQYESLPKWAQSTLADHEKDKRPFNYTLEEFAESQTHDPLWNAAQRQLVREGRMQNYLRMLWGKKILEWTPSPKTALDFMIELNNRYALDGRDPNSYSGIFWVLGRYDRAWGPERPIFGTIRYMSSENTAKKLKLKRYLQTWGEA